MNDLEFLTNWRQWPRTHEGYPYCCLSRDVNGKREYGYLLNGYPDVHHGIIFDRGYGGSGGVSHYGSMQQILSEGWRVD